MGLSLGLLSSYVETLNIEIILAVEPPRQTEQGKITDNMEKKFGRGDEGKWSLMEGHYTDGSG